ncbi:AAA family ATPase [Paenarthrobacter sp. Z7-10]|uniref:AAA family ATPase n=1 Tax=Paenarthrobacter sp. Z7-10 TaxID=2787635 RepID=UPI0022A90596|nr:AAA family ATPase [Paenarthrobacter sp. Z7-10]MCZ2403537.1 AAA family ATPase [Paenarthrobacter sp. Z7-10]
MAESLILVNGLPGAGKSTLSNLLGEELGVPVVSKDRIKEALADICLGKVGSGRLGQIASETMWQAISAVPGTVIAESWWYRPRDLGSEEERYGNSR